MIVKKGLTCFPAPFARAIANDAYDPGVSDYTVTQLLSPPQRTWLATKGGKVESGYAATMSVFGTGVHNVLENHVDKEAGELAEVRFYKQINGLTIGGKIDLYVPGEVHDWKVTAKVQDQAKPEHHDQAQMNGLLASHNGLPVNVVAVNYFDRAWSYLQSVVNPTYPKTAFTSFVFDFDPAYAEKRFNETIADHVAAKAGRPRPCTDDERWKKPDTYALMKPGAKRASKVCDSLAEAESLKKPDQIIQARPGESTYCKFFCGFSHICRQYQSDLAQQSEEP
jgi:hypothetical protein